MDFKITFKDGANGYLSHHGVVGMHWGVWNPETRAKKMGYKDIRKITRGSSSQEEAIAKLKASMGDARSKQLKDARNRLDIAEEEVKFQNVKNKLTDPSSTHTFKNAQEDAAEKYIRGEMKKSKTLYKRNPMAKQQLTEYAYNNIGYSAGKKAYDKTNFGQKRANIKLEKARIDYYKALEDDVNRLVKRNAKRKVKEAYTNAPISYKDLVRSALDTTVINKWNY